MSNFLELDAEDAPEQRGGNLRELVSRIPVATSATRLHPEVSDKLAQERGFTSREATTPRVVGGRRSPRGVQVEETRQLSIRMPVSLYEEFLDFADAQKLTYNEAIRALLDRKQKLHL